MAGSDGDSQGMAIQELEYCQEVVAGSTMNGTLVMLTLLYHDVVRAVANGVCTPESWQSPRTHHDPRMQFMRCATHADNYGHRQ